MPYVDGGTQRFPRIVGTGNALYLLETGVRIDARRAFAMGFVQEIVPAGAALDRALELAEAIATYPGQAGIRADRASAIGAFDQPLGEGLMREGAAGLETLADPEVADGLRRYAEGARPEAPRPAGLA